MDSKPEGRPLVVADGVGVDSTAMLVGLAERGVRPDLILFADTGGEKDETYDYIAVQNEWLERVGFPALVIVRYQAGNFKNYPPYKTLEENCLTNGTLPSLAFGFKSCSIKWKATPQNKYVANWKPAQECWMRGQRVVKLIGYDNSPKDQRRTFTPGPDDDGRYEYRYPLQDWGWDRERCKDEIRRAGLPVPPKSSCFFCPAMKPEEVRALPKDKLRRIVVMEARAKPRLEKIEGLWRTTRKRDGRPGMMTEFIRQEGLLPSDEINALAAHVPKDIVRNQERFARGDAIPSWEEYFEGLPSFCAEVEE